MKRRNLVPPNQPPQRPQQMTQQQQQQRIQQQRQQQPQQFVQNPNQNNGPITSIRGQSAFSQQPPQQQQQQQRVSFQNQNQNQQPKNELLNNIDESQIKYAPRLTIPNAITLLSLRVGRNENSIQELLHHKQNFANVDNNTIDDSVFKNIVERLTSVEKTNVELLLTLNKTQNELEECKQELANLQGELVMFSNTIYQDGEGEEQGGEIEFNLNQDETDNDENENKKIITLDVNAIEMVITEQTPQPTEEIVVVAEA